MRLLSYLLNLFSEQLAAKYVQLQQLQGTKKKEFVKRIAFKLCLLNELRQLYNCLKKLVCLLGGNSLVSGDGNHLVDVVD